MISGTRKVLCAVMNPRRLLLLALSSLPVIVAAATPDAPDVTALISRLAKPAPATIDFTEVRFSRLLKQPLIVSGTLGYAGPDILDRQVVTPYRETTQIRGTAVRVQRDGEPERSFALKRAPELQGLLSAFTALLAGDASAVERNFSIDAGGTEESWRITLAPRDARLARRVEQIVIDGHNDQPRCFWIHNGNDGASAMLLGLTSHLELPQPLTREWLERRCRLPT